MQRIYVAGIAGIIASAFSAIGLYLWQMQIDLSINMPLWHVLLFAGTTLANVAYWYGLSLVGTKYHNALFHRMALLAIVFSILMDASNALFVLFPQYAAVSAWGAFSFLMGTAMGIALIMTGLAAQKLRQHLGDTAVWYGVGSMFSGALLLAQDFGNSYIGLFAMTLNIALYIFGSMMLFQAAKK